jgi:hypothetical protein
MGKISIGSNIIYDDTGGSSETPRIRFKSAARDVEISTGTSLNVVMPLNINAGDLLLLVVYNRSTLTTPSGWTQLIQQGPFGTANQYNRIFYKIASGSESGQNQGVVQGASGRMGASIIVAECPGTLNIVDTKTAFVSGTGTLDIPAVTISSGDFVIIIASNVTTATSGVVRIYINSNDVMNLTRSNVEIPRFAYAVSEYKGRLVGSFYSSHSTNADTGMSVAVLNVV